MIVRLSAPLSVCLCYICPLIHPCLSVLWLSVYLPPVCLCYICPLIHPCLSVCVMIVRLSAPLSVCLCYICPFICPLSVLYLSAYPPLSVCYMLVLLSAPLSVCVMIVRLSAPLCVCDMLVLLSAALSVSVSLSCLSSCHFLLLCLRFLSRSIWIWSTSCLTCKCVTRRLASFTTKSNVTSLHKMVAHFTFFSISDYCIRNVIFVVSRKRNETHNFCLTLITFTLRWMTTTFKLSCSW